jgi:hypothetical protein
MSGDIGEFGADRPLAEADVESACDGNGSIEQALIKQFGMGGERQGLPGDVASGESGLDAA